VHGILPVIFGSVLGALVVTMLLSGDRVDGPSAEVMPTPQRTAPSTPDALSQPDFGSADTVVTLKDIPSITDPADRREAALALLDIYGHDAAGIDAVAASLPAIEAINFRIHAIADLGATDMQAAFAAVMALPDHEQRRLTLLRLATVLAATDPLAAIAAIEQIDSPDLETAFAAALFDAWAAREPGRVFSYLESADMSTVSAIETALGALAASDPERLLAMVDDLRRDIAALATTAALESLIERDAAAALARIDALPPGADRSRLERSAAESYGEKNPEAAWEWAMATKATPLAANGVVRGIQKVDPDRAWEIMLSQLNSTNDQVRAGTREYLMNYVNAVVNSESPDDIVIGLDRLLSLNDPRVDADMQTNIQAWANRDPEAALDWSLRNLERVNSTGLLTSLSAGLARTNIDLARDTIFRLDAEQRTAWAAGVGRTLAETDLAAARSWAYEFPSGPMRDAGIHEVIRGEAHGGTIDRQLFDGFSSDSARSEAASSAARRFACDGRAALAREIATAYITDQRLLEETERGIQQNSNGETFANSFFCQFTL
jgi:hypothetical protein